MSESELQLMRRILVKFADQYPAFNAKVIARGRWLRMEYDRTSDGNRVYTNFHDNTRVTLAMTLADMIAEQRTKEQADAKTAS